MEVFIRGISERENERNLEAFFDDVLGKLKFKDWICQKLGSKPFAKLVFLRPEDGQRFLRLHGLVKSLFGCNELSPGATYLLLKGKPLLCTQSDRLDQMALRSLEMSRQARLDQRTTVAIPSKADPKRINTTLKCTSISCGVWGWKDSSIYFAPQFSLKAQADVTFKAKKMVLEMSTSHRLEIQYQTIESVTWQDFPDQGMTFTLRESPLFSKFPNSSEPASLEALFQSFDIDIKESSPRRERVEGFNEEHKKVSGSCLVYQVSLVKRHDLVEQMKNINQIRGCPSTIRRQIPVGFPAEPYNVGFDRMVRSLSSSTTTLPFSIRFQVQKLAQNVYLLPNRVVAIIPEFWGICSRSGERVCLKVIRKFFRQIPYAGPDVEASYFDPTSLVQVLREIESEIKCGGLFPGEPVASQHVAVIHKATVTPTGTYLYGPEGECNNRVLRKYSQHHDCFLRVQFSDEDGLPVHYSREVSNKPIFDRFKKILNEGGTIGGQHFSFLGFSHSSLRSQSCWFMAPFTHEGKAISYRDVIDDLGDFSDIRIPAKCAARIGQAFSDTRDAITLPPGIVKEMSDVKLNGRVFSDGVGTISSEALEMIWAGLLGGRRRPTVLQIRYQGTPSSSHFHNLLPEVILSVRCSKHHIIISSIVILSFLCASLSPAHVR